MDKLKINPNFFKEFDVSEKAYKQFLKTRKKTSKSSLTNSKTLNCEAINPIFTPFMGNLNSGDLKKKEEMIHDIKNYKPKTAYLELHKIKKNEDQKANEEFFKIVNRMKKIEQKTHDKNLLKEKEHLEDEIEKKFPPKTLTHFFWVRILTIWAKHEKKCFGKLNFHKRFLKF